MRSSFPVGERSMKVHLVSGAELGLCAMCATDALCRSWGEGTGVELLGIYRWGERHPILRKEAKMRYGERYRLSHFKPVLAELLFVHAGSENQSFPRFDLEPIGHAEKVNVP